MQIWSVKSESGMIIVKRFYYVFTVRLKRSEYSNYMYHDIVITLSAFISATFHHFENFNIYYYILYNLSKFVLVINLFITPKKYENDNLCKIDSEGFPTYSLAFK